MRHKPEFADGHEGGFWSALLIIFVVYLAIIGIAVKSRHTEPKPEVYDSRYEHPDNP